MIVDNFSNTRVRLIVAELLICGGKSNISHFLITQSYLVVSMSLDYTAHIILFWKYLINKNFHNFF